jgi:hypothetical protein
MRTFKIPLDSFHLINILNFILFVMLMCHIVYSVSIKSNFICQRYFARVMTNEVCQIKFARANDVLMEYTCNCAQ